MIQESRTSGLLSIQVLVSVKEDHTNHSDWKEERATRMTNRSILRTRQRCQKTQASNLIACSESKTIEDRYFKLRVSMKKDI